MFRLEVISSWNSNILIWVLPLFEKNKLNGMKRFDFQDFKKVATLMENRDHLTLSGVNEIKKIKSNMNTQRTYNL